MDARRRIRPDVDEGVRHGRHEAAATARSTRRLAATDRTQSPRRALLEPRRETGPPRLAACLAGRGLNHRALPRDGSHDVFDGEGSWQPRPPLGGSPAGGVDGPPCSPPRGAAAARRVAGRVPRGATARAQPPPVRWRRAARPRPPGHGDRGRRRAEARTTRRSGLYLWHAGAASPPGDLVCGCKSNLELDTKAANRPKPSGGLVARSSLERPPTASFHRGRGPPVERDGRRSSCRAVRWGVGTCLGVGVDFFCPSAGGRDRSARVVGRRPLAEWFYARRVGSPWRRPWRIWTLTRSSSWSRSWTRRSGPLGCARSRICPRSRPPSAPRSPGRRS